MRRKRRSLPCCELCGQPFQRRRLWVKGRGLLWHLWCEWCRYLEPME
jgi:hypothetical protein